MWLVLPEEAAGIGDQQVPGHQSGPCQLALTFNHCPTGSRFEPVTREENLHSLLTNSSLSPSLPRLIPCPIKLHFCHWICQHAYKSLKGEINLNYRIGQTHSKVHFSEIEANISDMDPFETVASVSLLELGQGWETYAAIRGISELFQILIFMASSRWTLCAGGWNFERLKMGSLLRILPSLTRGSVWLH